MSKKEEITRPLQFLKGIGPKKAEALEKEGLVDLVDLIHYYPVSYISRSSIMFIDDLISHLGSQQKIFEEFDHNKEVNFRSEYTIQGKVLKKDLKRLRGKKELLTIVISDGSKHKAKVNFWKFASYFSKIYPLGTNLLVVGKSEWDKWGLTFSHPEIEIIEEDEIEEFNSGKIIPNYRIGSNLSKAKINNKILRSATKISLEKASHLVKECLPNNLIKRNHLLNYSDTLLNIHFPENEELLSRSILRMKFDELFFYQLLIQKTRIKLIQDEQAPEYIDESPSARKVYEMLPFELTSDQKKSLNEIANDLKKGKPMNRLLQGDVGSGKTITSLLSILMMVDSGYQCAMLAPTEILSEQHYALFFSQLKELDIETVILSGGQKTKKRREVLEKIKSGKAKIIVGTHAAFLNEIEYNNLAYIVIDEQHRFGVAQRAKIREMASKSLANNLKPHILIMSATPIPRTLEMTFYGDLDVSLIKSKPKGRKEIKTKIIFDDEINKAYEFIRTEAKERRQSFIVFPLVEKSEKLDLKAAEDEFLRINQEILPELECGLIHGRMNSDEKDFIMNKFKEKKYDVLISTTVIEVGIDIPNASVMLIENSERFGLSQLHQLRGRVGRGNTQSYCLLSAPSKLRSGYHQNTDDLKKRNAALYRLKVMENTNDGFLISEADLKLRGPGDLLGTKQSGMPDFKFADLTKDIEIIKRTKEEAIRILSEDPKLIHEDHAIIKENMNRFKEMNRSFFDIA